MRVGRQQQRGKLLERDRLRANIRQATVAQHLLNTIRTGLEGALIFTLLLATIVSYAVARTVTRNAWRISRPLTASS